MKKIKKKTMKKNMIQPWLIHWLYDHNYKIETTSQKKEARRLFSNKSNVKKWDRKNKQN